MDNALVNAATAAKLLGMGKSSLYRLAKIGTIPSYACGAKLSGRRFDVMEVREVLKALALKQVAS